MEGKAGIENAPPVQTVRRFEVMQKKGNLPNPRQERTASTLSHSSAILSRSMRQPKKWLVTFSLLYRDGHVRNQETRVKAESIMDAIREAQAKIYRVYGEEFATDIDRYVIWDVGIINNWVF